MDALPTGPQHPLRERPDDNLEQHEQVSSAAATGGIIGPWAGRVTQRGAAATPQSYQVLMAVKATAGGTLIGRTAYRGLNCAGQLQLRNAHGNSYRRVTHSMVSSCRNPTASGTAA